MAKTKPESTDLSEDEREPAAETRYPTNPEDWRSRHFLSLLGRFERAWDACPKEKQPILRAMVLDLVGGGEKGGAA